MTVVYLGAGSAVGSTVTLATLVGRVRSKFLGDEPWEDTLSGAQTAVATQATLSNPTKWGLNDLLEMPDGEVERVSPQTVPLSNPVTVKRAHNGTTAAAHSSGDVVLKNPRFPFQIINDQLSQVATNLTWPFMWVLSSVTITPSPTTTDLYAISDVAFQNPIVAVQQTTGTITETLTYDRVEIVPVPAAIASTGIALRMPSFDNLANDVTLYYQAKITTSTIPEGDIAEAITYKAVANVLRYKGIQARNSDTGIYGQDMSARGALEAALAQQIRDYDNQWRNEKYRIRANLHSQYMPQERWTSFANILPTSRRTGVLS